MKEDVFVKKGIVIPEHELEITASRSSGPGGQHVNKTNTRITVRWNAKESKILNERQRARLLEQLKNDLTTTWDLIVYSDTSRSQQQNKESALLRLADKIRKALYVQKRRIPTKISAAQKEARLHTKTHRSFIKKTRNKKIITED